MTLTDDVYIKDHELASFPQVTNVDFRDKRIIHALEDETDKMHEKVLESLTMLATCHTVIVD